jgi:hypothetical protein
MAIKNPLWDEFILWSLLPDVEKGEWATENDWAVGHGTTARTLRRWKQQPEFVARRDELSKVAEVTRIADVEASDLSGDEGDYRVVKSTLVAGAKSGNPKYLELYFKTYGKPFVEEEAASRVADMADADLDDLVLEALFALGESVVVDALRNRGWTVEK